MTIPPSLAQPSFSQAPIETTDPNAISKTIVDAKGDLIAGTADNAVTRQPVGTDGEFLVADSSQATGLDWVANPVNTAFDAKGDLLVGTGADTYAKLPVGTNNQVLVADSSQASGVRWSSEQDPNAIVKSIVDAKGDLIAATADDTPARLPVGTNDQLLIADSAQSTGLKWGRPTIALGTETSGDYVAGVTGGTGVTVTGSGGEGSTPSVAIGQAVGTGDTVAFGGLNVDSGTLYVDSTNNRVGINDTTPSYSLDVTGDGHFTSDLTVDGITYANHIHGNLAGSLYYHIKNNSGSTINVGTPVYITGTVGSTQVAEVSPSRADTSSTMPAVGITGSTLAQGDTGHMIVIGNLDGVNTNAYTLSQPLFVGASGGLTNTRPTGASDVIQVIAYAARINSSTGELIVNAYDQVRSPNSISIVGNIATTAGQFTGSGAGLTSIPAGQLTGTISSTNIGNDSVALGTKTTGDYVATLQAGTGVTVTNGSGEGVSPTVAIGQAVGIADSPQFAAITTTGTASLNAASVTGSVSANSLSATTSTTTSSLIVDGIEIDTTGATTNQVLSYNGTKFAPSSPGAAAAGSLTGTTLASNVVSSSLTSVGTLGSLTVTGDVTVDTNTLKVDATNNRVGVNNSSPTVALDVTGAEKISGDLTVATTAFTVNSTTGKVGVGTASPASTLDVIGSISARTSPTQDGVALSGRVGGTGTYEVTLTPTTLTADRTLTLPDATGTVALNSGANADYVSPYTGFRNAIINGDFRINQRAWSSSTTDGTYGFDRWAQSNSGGTVTMSSQTFTVGSPAATGYESPTFLRMVTSGQSTSGHYAGFYHHIEDVRTFANSTVTVSFWAKASSGTPKISLENTQFFGSGGSPSSFVQTPVGAVTISTSWARYSFTFAVPSISGKTIGTTANTSSLRLFFFVSAGSSLNTVASSIGIQNNTFDIWGIQCERGSVATPFEQRPIQTELALCQRYYWRNIGVTNGAYFGGGTSDASSGIYITVQHPVPMRIAPTSVETNANITDTSVTITPTGTSIYLAGTMSTTLKNTHTSYVQYRWYAFLLNTTSLYLGLNAEF